MGLETGAASPGTLIRRGGTDQTERPRLIKLVRSSVMAQFPASGSILEMAHRSDWADPSVALPNATSVDLDKDDGLRAVADESCDGVIVHHGL